MHRVQRERAVRRQLFPPEFPVGLAVRADLGRRVHEQAVALAEPENAGQGEHAGPAVRVVGDQPPFRQHPEHDAAARGIEQGAGAVEAGHRMRVEVALDFRGEAVVAVLAHHVDRLAGAASRGGRGEEHVPGPEREEVRRPGRGTGRAARPRRPRENRTPSPMYQVSPSRHTWGSCQAVSWPRLPSFSTASSRRPSMARSWPSWSSHRRGEGSTPSVQTGSCSRCEGSSSSGGGWGMTGLAACLRQVSMPSSLVAMHCDLPSITGASWRP